MNILGAIPSKDRNWADHGIEILDPFCNEIIVMLQGTATVENIGSRAEVVKRPPDGISGQRNYAVREAILGGYDALFFVDDDVRVDHPPVDNLIGVFKTYPYLGTLSLDSNWSLFYSKDVETNTGFRTEAHAGQCHLLRVKALREIVNEYSSVYDNFRASIDDVYAGLLMWSLGWGVGKINSKERSMCYSAIQGAVKTADKGGILSTDRDKELFRAKEIFHDMFILKDNSNLDLVYSFKVHFDKKKGIYRQRQRFNYHTMQKNFKTRWSDVGYIDSRGKHRCL